MSISIFQNELDNSLDKPFQKTLESVELDLGCRIEFLTRRLEELEEKVKTVENRLRWKLK